MILTGKCKEDFKKWYAKSKHAKAIDICHFEAVLTDEMKYGVYVDFFDSVDINIDIDIDSDKTFDYLIFHSNDEGWLSSRESLTRSQTIRKAIEKANEIYNKTKK